MEPKRVLKQGENRTLGDLNLEIKKAVKKSTDRIHDLPIGHILPGCAQTLVDAFGSITFTPQTSRKIAKLRYADPKKFGETIELIRKAHEIYAEGEHDLQKIHDKLPSEAKDSYTAFRRREAEWKDFHNACAKHGFNGANELMEQLETHARRKNKAKKLVAVLEQAHEDKNMSDLMLRKKIENIFYPEN